MNKLSFYWNKAVKLTNVDLTNVKYGVNNESSRFAYCTLFPANDKVLKFANDKASC